MLETLGIVFSLLLTVGLIVGIVLLIEFCKDMFYRIDALEYRNKKEDDKKWHDAFYQFKDSTLGKTNDNVCVKCGKSDCCNNMK